MKIKRIRIKTKNFLGVLLAIFFIVFIGVAIVIFPIEQNTIDSASIEYAKEYLKNEKGEDLKTYENLESYLVDNLAGLDDVSDFEYCSSVIVLIIPSAFNQQDTLEGLNPTEAFKVRDNMKKGEDYDNGLKKSKELEMDIVNKVGFRNVKQYINSHSFELSFKDLSTAKWEYLIKKTEIDEIAQMGTSESLLMSPFINIYCIQKDIDHSKFADNEIVVGIFQNKAEVKDLADYEEIIIKDSTIREDGTGYASLVSYVKDEETKSINITKMELYFTQSNSIFESKWEVSYKNISTLKLNYINGDKREIYTILSNIE